MCPPAGNHAQQRGFAGAVASGHHHGFAAGQAETKPYEHITPAAVAGQFFARELHQARRSPAAGCGPAAVVVETPDILRIFCNDLGKYGVGREKTL